jgi:hypothetical protein
MTDDKLLPSQSKWQQRRIFHLGSVICHRTSLRRVDVLLHFECASDQADLLRWLRYNLDNVETKWDVREIEQAKPFFSGANDPGSLPPIDRFMRCPEKLVCTGFDFDKDQDLFLAIAADEVDLATAARPEISIKDLKGLFL